MSAPAHRGIGAAFVPSIQLQCWGFMAGSALFALGSAPYLAAWMGVLVANVFFFIGSWFFTTAACVQLAISAPAMVASDTTKANPQLAIRAAWLAAAVQLLGTILFNISTSEALSVLSVDGERRFVWAPNADGSTAFLISSFLALAPHFRHGIYWAPRSIDWSSAILNLLGSIAFAVSAVASIVTPTGAVVDASIASIGTFIGAILFFLASAVILQSQRTAPTPQVSGERHVNH